MEPEDDLATTLAINAALAEAYPDNFIDVVPVLLERETRSDDGLHLSSLGLKRIIKILGEAIRERIAALDAAQLN